jgi:hypothetical protein
VLAVGRDHHDLVPALGAPLVEVLRDLGRGRDRVVAHHVEVDLPRGDRGHLVAAREPDRLRGLALRRLRHRALPSSHG